MEIILLSFPVFYIIGLVTFIRWLAKVTKSKTSDRVEFLKREISELSQTVNKSPTKNVSDLLLEYIGELEELTDKKISELVDTTPGEKVPLPSSVAVPSEEGTIIEERPVQKPTLEEDLNK